MEKLQDDVWPYDPFMQHKIASYRHQQALSERNVATKLITVLSVMNTTIDHSHSSWSWKKWWCKWKRCRKKQNAKKKKKNPTCCDRSGYRRQPCRRDVSLAMPVVCSRSTQHALQTTQLLDQSAMDSTTSTRTNNGINIDRKCRQKRLSLCARHHCTML